MKPILLALFTLFFIAAKAQTDTLVLSMGGNKTALTGTIKSLTDGVFTIKINGNRFQYNAGDVSHIYVSDANTNKEKIMKAYGDMLSKAAYYAKLPTMLKDVGTGKIMLADTVLADTLSSKVIFDRARQFLTSTTLIDNKVVSYVDSTAYEIVIDGRNDLNSKRYPMALAVGIDYADLTYQVYFVCRNGKYKLVLTYVYLKFSGTYTAEGPFENNKPYSEVALGAKIPYDSKSNIMLMSLPIFKGLEDAVLNGKNDW